MEGSISETELERVKLNYETEAYVDTHILNRAQTSALAKFRCGVAPLELY